LAAAASDDLSARVPQLPALSRAVRLRNARRRAVRQRPPFARRRAVQNRRVSLRPEGEIQIAEQKPTPDERAPGGPEDDRKTPASHGRSMVRGEAPHKRLSLASGP